MTTEEQQEQLADTLMQRMAKTAPVTQRWREGRWLIIWGNGAVGEEGTTRFEAVMKIMDGLISASPVADPRIAAPSSKRHPSPDDPPPAADIAPEGADLGAMKEGSVDVDQASDDGNDQA